MSMYLFTFIFPLAKTLLTSTLHAKSTHVVQEKDEHLGSDFDRVPFSVQKEGINAKDEKRDAW